MSDGHRIRILLVDHVSKVLGGAEVNVLELLAHPGVRDAWDVTVACAPDSPLARAIDPPPMAPTRPRFRPRPQ